ncbi:MAG: hypothetical protein MUC87_04750 [Bacteroidia bacterium]|jgi:hypothetical protein|nr:hypothetical protein [Bacteroidia bacterium]
MKRLLFSCLLLTGFTQATAQDYFSLLNPGSQYVYAGVSAAPALMAQTGYAFSGVTIKDKPLVFTAGITLPLFSQKGFDAELNVGAGYQWALAKNWNMITGLSWNIMRSQDINGRYLCSGFKLDMLPAYYTSHWMTGPHLALDYRPWLHIRHSDYSKEAYTGLYPSGSGTYTTPRDGWFLQDNLALQLGAGVAYFRTHWNINLKAGFNWQPNRLGLISLPDIGIMPFYGSVNVGYKLH